jgi:hypothetical protein
MKNIIISAVTIIALLVTTFPAQAEAEQAAALQQSAKPALLIRKGQNITTLEAQAYGQLDALSVQRISQEAGGAEASTEVIILATIGLLVLVGAVIYAAGKNNEEE